MDLSVAWRIFCFGESSFMIDRTELMLSIRQEVGRIKYIRWWVWGFSSTVEHWWCKHKVLGFILSSWGMEGYKITKEYTRWNWCSQLICAIYCIKKMNCLQWNVRNLWHALVEVIVLITTEQPMSNRELQ